MASRAFVSFEADPGLINEMRRNPLEWQGKTVVFVHTGGLLGTYSHAEQLVAALKPTPKL